MFIARPLIRPYTLTLLVMTTLIMAVHWTAEMSIVQGVRRLLAGVASTAAEGLMALPRFAAAFESIDGSLALNDTGDPRWPEFLRIAAFLDGIKRRHAEQAGVPGGLALEFRYIYTLRRLSPEDRPPRAAVDGEGRPVDLQALWAQGAREAWQFVVDADWEAEDTDGDGVISEAEAGVYPGQLYPEAENLPMLRTALRAATADERINRDPWGTWLSGYAPLRDAAGGRTIGVLGVDLNQRDLTRTLLHIRLVSAGAWLAFGALLTLAFHFLSGRLKAYEALRRLDIQLEQQNEQLRLTNQSLESANRQFARQLELARRVQQRFLPSHFPRSDQVAFGSIYLACEAVGGDIYDVFPIDAEHIGLYIADVSGHGISAALIGATLKMSVEAMKATRPNGGGQAPPLLLQPREVVAKLHEILSENLERDHFITMQYAVIATQRHSVTLCNAGHTRPVWWRAAERRAEIVETDSGLPIGYLEKARLAEQTIALQPGDKMVLYTDGLTETSSPLGEMFGEERLAAAVERHGEEGAQPLVESLKREADTFAGGAACPDDVALVVVEILRGGGGSEG